MDEGSEELRHDLKCVVPARGGSRDVTYTVTGSQGLRLVCQSSGIGSTETRLVGEAHAKDKDHFWWLWRHYNPGTELKWEDGEPFIPS